MLSDIDLMMLSDMDKGMDMISTIVLNADDDDGLKYPVCRSCPSEDPSRRAFMGNTRLLLNACIFVILPVFL